MNVSRRVALGLAAGGLAAASGVAGAAPPTEAFPDPALLYRKLKYRTDDGPVFWWMRGPKYGVVDAEMTALWTIEVGIISTVAHRPDGGFDTTSLEIIFMTDPTTGARLEQWRNPYTREVLPGRVALVGPTTTRYDRQNGRTLPTTLGGAPLSVVTRRAEPIIVGDDIFVQDEVVARVMSPGRTRPYIVNDISLLQGSVANLASSAVTFGNARVTFAEVTGWQRWLNMGERPGSMTSRTVGAKVERYEQLPARWRAMLAGYAPEIAQDPLGALAKPPFRFER
jgi:hypothetical protein